MLMEKGYTGNESDGDNNSSSGGSGSSSSNYELPVTARAPFVHWPIHGPLPFPARQDSSDSNNEGGGSRGKEHEWYQQG